MFREKHLFLIKNSNRIIYYLNDNYKNINHGINLFLYKNLFITF